MTKVFFTADCHFEHEAIIKHCNRPFKNKEHMNETIIKRWNNKVKENDLVYHLGDFAFKGESKAKEFSNKLNGEIVHIQGNHDKNNGVKTYITHAIMEFGGLILYVKHKPPVEFQEGTMEETIISVCDVILCGHVHNLWKHSYTRDKLVINVGQDVWGFEPITIHSILKYISRIRRK
jgi:calcineurin-like phosphoesterase family protein